MRVLVVGGGGREHAIAWKLKQDDQSIELHAAPGNPGVATLATCHPVQATDLDGIVALATRERVDLTVVGPEAPLASGLVDRLAEGGLRAFGPTAAAARVEASKRFAKELMLGAGIPTARATWHRDVGSARAAARALGAPVVIKASGLASGKGVAVCDTAGAADAAIDDMLQEHRYGASGDEVLVEEFMESEELSVFALTDGTDFVMMLPAQDHKRLRRRSRPEYRRDERLCAGGTASDALRDVERSIIGPTSGARRPPGDLSQPVCAA